MSHAAHANTGDHQHDAGHTGAHAHGHTIIPMRMLVLVLVTLLVFTGLTVFVANAEQLVAKAFGIVLPHWVNVVVALSIAAVKSIIVAAYFMQLRYDNPLNTMVAVFTLLVLTFFLGFTMIDLGNRKALYDYKGTAIVDGGFGNIAVVGGQVKDQLSIAMFARERADKEIDSLLGEGKELTKTLAARLVHRTMEIEESGKPVPELYEKYLDKHPDIVAKVLASSHGGHGGGHASKHSGSTGDAARIKTGLTLPEFAPVGGEHGSPAPHGDAKPEAKSDAQPKVEPKSGH
jgi:cytochrome c oxidase subunit IV